VSFLTKKEMTVATIIIMFVLIVGGIAAYICLKRDIIKLPDPQIKLIDDRVTEKEVAPRATALNNSSHTESVLAATTISTGYKTEIKAYYQLNDGSHFYHTVMDFVPGEGNDPSGKSILQYNISHALTDAPTVKECLDWKLDPRVTALIVTWYVPYEDGNVCFSLMDVDGDGEWDLLANENIKFAHSDEEGANLVYEDKAGHQIYAEYERAKEVTSDLTYETAMEEWLTQEDPE
jgi:hypothetical protein